MSGKEGWSWIIKYHMIIVSSEMVVYVSQNPQNVLSATQHNTCKPYIANSHLEYNEKSLQYQYQNTMHHV